MCGVVGMLTFHGSARHWRGAVADAMALMSSRGPDSAGVWADDACILGFRRLSIIDLSPAADQPLVTADGRYSLVFNGELYNFREIRSSLEGRGVQLRSHGDAEVVLHALAHFGIGALGSFNGMFALAFYDSLERRVLLARDHAAIKPMYLLRHRDGVLFASQYDVLAAHPWATGRTADRGALSLYLNIGYLPPPAAILEGTEALEAGTWVTFTAGGAERRGRWFELPRFREPDLRGDEALEAVDAAVTAAVRRQLVSDVPLGVLLSGGIDSPLVAAKAQQAQGPGTSLPAFTIGTGGGLDESADAGRYADALGLRHVVRHMTSTEVLGLLDDVVRACSEPSDDYSIFPTAMVSRLAREQVTVVLSGDGGDDVFWGYPDRMIAPLARMGAGRLRDRFPGFLGRRARGRHRHNGEAQIRMHRFVEADTLAAIFPGLSLSPPDSGLFSFDSDDVDRTAQFVRWNEYTGHLAKVLQKVDRASMLFSLEVRVPLLDREVVEVAARVSWRDCVDARSGIGKLPLRAALRRHVPFQVRDKRGFTVPMSAWLRGPLRHHLEDLVVSRSDFLGIPVDRASLSRTARDHYLRRRSSPWLLWRLLSLALWESGHLRRQLPASGGRPVHSA